MSQSNSKSTDKRPARKKYWTSRRLEIVKVKHMMKAYGLDAKKAAIRWYAERKTRVPSLFVKDHTKGVANTHKKKGKVHTEEEIYAFELAGLHHKLRNRLAGLSRV